MSDKKYLEKCRSGNHPFIIILTSRQDVLDSLSVVRWCPICGAVVVDMECDSRIYPGRVVNMKLPKITQEEANQISIKK